jgi:phospholipid N-methyltransferase
MNNINNTKIDNVNNKDYDYITNILNNKKINNKLQPTETSNNIDALLKMIYSTKKGSRNYEELQRKWKRKKVFFDIIESSDFYPTPLYISSIIKNEVEKHYDNYTLYDMAAGLGSLSRAFLDDTSKIKKIVLLEYEEEFVKVLKDYQNENKKINVKHTNFFEYNLKLKQKDESVIICNPPFTGSIGGVKEPLLWLYFVIKILNSMNNLHTQQAYFVLPKSNLFKIKNKPMYYTKTEEGQQCELHIPPAKIKKINKAFDIDIDYDITFINNFSYMGNVTGFQGISKNGKPTKAPDCALFCINLNLMSYI